MPPAPPPSRSPDRSAGRLRSAADRPLVQLLIELGLAAAAVAGGAALGRVASGGATPRETDLLTPTLTAALLVAVLATAARLVERSSLAATGFVRHRATRDFALGAAGGVAAMAIIVGLFALAGWYRVVGLTPAPAVPGLLARWGWLLFAAAVTEEVIFRAILFRLVERAAGTGVAVGASALLFGLAHLGTPHATLAGALAIALEAGVALAALYVLTRSLWPVLGVHWGWNLAEGPVFGTQISGHDFGAGASVLHAVLPGPTAWTGGAFGPAAGLAAVLLWTLVGAALLARARRAGRWVAPPWVRDRPRPAQAAS